MMKHRAHKKKKNTTVNFSATTIASQHATMSDNEEEKIEFTITCPAPCEKTTVSVNSPFLAKFYCHCKECKTLCQASVVCMSAFPIDTFKVEKGSTKVLKRDDMKHYPVICSECGITLYARNEKFQLEKIGRSEIARCNNPEIVAKCDPPSHLFYGERDLDIADNRAKFLDLPKSFGGSGKLCNVDGTVIEGKEAQQQWEKRRAYTVIDWTE